MDPQYDKLVAWKKKAIKIDNQITKKEIEIESKQKQQREKEFNDLIEAVEELDRKRIWNAKQKMRELEKLEEERLLKRSQDKATAGALRLEMIRRKNVEDMTKEDIRSMKMKLYNWEQACIQRDRLGMEAEERKQTKIDRFWGIPTEIRRLKEEAERRRMEMKRQVDLMREVCIQIRVTRPFSWEYGKFRERDTNKIIM